MLNGPALLSVAEQPIHPFWQAAHRYLKDGNLNAAKDQLQQILEEDLLNLPALQCLSFLHWYDDEPEQTVNTLLLVAEHYSRQQSWLKAAQLLLYCQQLQPDALLVAQQAAKICLQLQLIDDGSRCLAQVARLTAQKQDLAAARAAWQALITFNPQYTTAYLQLALLLQQQQQNHQAAVLLQQALPLLTAKAAQLELRQALQQLTPENLDNQIRLVLLQLEQLEPTAPTTAEQLLKQYPEHYLSAQLRLATAQSQTPNFWQQSRSTTLVEGVNLELTTDALPENVAEPIDQRKLALARVWAHYGRWEQAQNLLLEISQGQLQRLPEVGQKLAWLLAEKLPDTPTTTTSKSFQPQIFNDCENTDPGL